MNSKVYKIVLLGNSHTGKTTYVNRLMGDQASTITTGKVEVSALHDGTNVYHLWDLSGDPLHDHIRAAYIVGADAAIIMLNDLQTVGADMQFWYNSLRSEAPNAPAVIAYTGKCNIQQSNTIQQMSNMLGMQYIDLCIDDTTQIEKPVMSLIEALNSTGVSTGQFDNAIMTQQYQPINQQYQPINNTSRVLTPTSVNTQAPANITTPFSTSLMNTSHQPMDSQFSNTWNMPAVNNTLQSGQFSSTMR